MTEDDAGFPRWGPDQQAWERWQRALAAAAEAVWPTFPGSSLASGVVGVIFDGAPPPLARRPLAFPQVWLESSLAHRQLLDLTDEVEATAELLDELQGDVIEEVYGAWPQCPRHPHPLDMSSTDDGRPVWRCTTTPDITFGIDETPRLGGPAR